VEEIRYAHTQAPTTSTYIYAVVVKILGDLNEPQAERIHRDYLYKIPVDSFSLRFIQVAKYFDNHSIYICRCCGRLIELPEANKLFLDSGPPSLLVFHMLARLYYRSTEYVRT
jgi:hypothetical protein